LIWLIFVLNEIDIAVQIMQLMMLAAAKFPEYTVSPALEPTYKFLSP
jgi:hypothetical protein